MKDLKENNVLQYTVPDWGVLKIERGKDTNWHQEKDSEQNTYKTNNNNTMNNIKSNKNMINETMKKKKGEKIKEIDGKMNENCKKEENYKEHKLMNDGGEVNKDVQKKEGAVVTLGKKEEETDVGEPKE